ncbi:Polyol transporter [Thalictrum thalictroides]|uniref:Polyol transporter n=1 Tax=Thalictrum thalictroides TaxID=46969 RepID=A0A7J6WHR6_THATH|nr:Polyol transporter [Thalictrum thalictroides]
MAVAEITSDPIVSEKATAVASSQGVFKGLNKFTFAVALLASTNSILLGYDIGVMSGAKLFIKETLHVSDKQIGILTGSLNLFSLIGSFASGKTSDCIGRRYTIILASVFFIIGALGMGLAPSFIWLMIGRMAAGIGVGYSLMIAPVYTAEISPASTRGFLGSISEIFINIGILLGYLSNYFLANVKYNWRLMLGISAFPPVVIIVGVLMMPESPRWLIMQGRREEAKRVLLKTSSGGEAEANMRLDDITLAAATSASINESNGHGVWRDLLLKPTTAVRRMLVASIGLNFFMQASGNDAVIYYTPEVFKSAGIHGQSKLFLVTIIMGIVKTSFVLISALFLDRFGRQPMLLLGTTGMTVSLVGLGLGSTYLYRSIKKPVWAIALCVVAVCADVSFFSIGLGPITWVYSSEIFPMRLRAQGSSIAVGVNRLISSVVTMTFPVLSKKITYGGMFFMFGGIMAIAVVFCYVFLPETKGKNLEDIEELFDSRRGNSSEG